MIKITLDGSGSLKLLETQVKGFSSKMNSRVASSINRTARSTRDYMIHQVSSKFNISKRNANKKKVFYQSKKAKASDLTAQVRLKESKKLGVQMFGPKHTGSGVTFALLKGGSRELIPKAFMGPRAGKKAPKLNGGVFIRQEGAKRLPINKLYAMSPWGMYRSGKMQLPTYRHAEKLMNQHINKGINELAKTL